VLYKSGRNGYLATELANKEKISIWQRYAPVRCAHPSFEGQYDMKTGRYTLNPPFTALMLLLLNKIIINRVE
jgi:hypothetical protein